MLLYTNSLFFRMFFFLPHAFSGKNTQYYSQHCLFLAGTKSTTITHTHFTLTKKGFKSLYICTRPFIFCSDLFCYYQQTVNPCWTRGNDQLARLVLCVCTNAVQPRPRLVSVGTEAAVPTNRNFKGRAHFRRRLWPPYRHNIFPLQAALDIRPSADSGSGQLHVSRPKKAVAAAAAEASCSRVEEHTTTTANAAMKRREWEKLNKETTKKTAVQPNRVFGSLELLNVQKWQTPHWKGLDKSKTKAVVPFWRKSIKNRVKWGKTMLLRRLYPLFMKVNMLHVIFHSLLWPLRT